MPNANDDARVRDGFGVLDGGVNDGIAASLIGINQLTFASNITFRGSYAKTREPFSNLLLTFYDPPEQIPGTTQEHFAGIFQGASGFESSVGTSGILCSVGGRLFFITIGLTNLVSEVTPTTAVLATQQPGTGQPLSGLSFTVPASGAQVLAYVSETEPFTVGESLVIDGGNYTVSDLGDGYLVLTYGSGAAHTSVAVGIPILNTSNAPILSQSLNPATFDFVYIFQAENYGIVDAGQNPPLIFYNGVAQPAGPNQIPPGIFGIYLWGRIWQVLPNRRNFVAGDLVCSSSGTPQNSYVDAILETTENAFLNGGGMFTSPSNRGLITAAFELAQVDTSLGTGNLMFSAQKGLFSVNTPVDRTTWQNLTYPIQTISLLNYGQTGPRFGCDSNNNRWYRSKDGIRDYISARRDFKSKQGNVPQSQEIRKILSKDEKKLLFYGSCVLFDNRLYFTASPYRTTNGVAHRGMIVMNQDTISDLRTDIPPLWEGLYLGLNILQLLTVTFDEDEQMFAFVLNGSTIELWQFGLPGVYDQFLLTSGESTSLTRTPIQSVIETRAFNCGDGDQLKQLLTGSIYVSDLIDNATIVVKYRPDQYPNWTAWATVNLCADVSQCSIEPQPATGGCVVWSPKKGQYAARIVLPQPESVDNLLSSKPMTWGYEHQIRMEITGCATFRKFIIECKTASDKTTDTTPPEVVCQTVSGCDLPIFGYDSHG